MPDVKVALFAGSQEPAHATVNAIIGILGDDATRQRFAAAPLDLPPDRANLPRGNDIMAMDPPTFLIDSHLPSNSVCVLYGPSGCFKTFVAVDWALSVATGTYWMGRTTAHGRVLYVAGEGVSGLAQRVAAWLHDRNLQTAGDIDWLTIAASLYAQEWLEAFVALVAERQPGFVIIDTLARSMVGADENSSRDMGIVVEAAEAVRAVSGATVLLVHHTGKDVSNGPRGSSALFAGMETVISCSGGEGSVTLKVEKHRNAPDGEKTTYRVVSVLDSCVIGDPRRHDIGSEVGSLSSGSRDALESLASIAVPGGVCRPSRNSLALPSRNSLVRRECSSRWGLLLAGCAGAGVGRARH
ncbi:MAG: hypothetical protein NVSMB4_04970 [Acidimicrobiales bacterium]